MDMGTSAAVVSWLMEHLNYGCVTLFMTIESSFIPFPSEVVVPPAAWKSMTDEGMNIVCVVLFATVGSNIGALVNYYLARWLGRPLIYRFANSRVGHLCLLSEEKLRHAEAYFRRHGATSTFIGRLVPAVRQLISIPAGLAGMKPGAFILYTTLGSGLWNAVLALLGYLIYRFTDLKSTADVCNLATKYSHEIGYAILAVIVVAVLVWLCKKQLKRKREA